MPIEKTISADALESTAAGADGASHIGINISGISANDVRTAIEVTKQLLDAKLAQIQTDGVALPSRPTLNVTGEGNTVTDDPVNGRTTLHIPGLADYPHIERLTLDGVEQGTYRALDVRGNVELELDGDNDRYRLNIPSPPELPLSDEVNPGAVRLTMPALDPLDPVVPGDNDSRLNDARPPLDHEHAGPDITSGTIDVARLAAGTPSPSTYIDGGTGEWTYLPSSAGGPISIDDLPISDDGESNLSEIPRASDTRLSNARPPTNGSVTLPTASDDISLPYICDSTTRPVNAKRGQIIYELDTDLVMKQVSNPATPNWQPVGTGTATILLQEEGVSIAQRGTIDIEGPGVTVSDDAVNNKSILSIPGLTVQNAGADVGTWARLNVIGATLVNDTVNQRVNLTIPGPGATASETVAGVAEIATQGEVNLGTDDQRIVTANKLNSNNRTRGFASVKDFGATGNGTTDDTTAIRDAIASLTSGGELYFPAGNYLVSEAAANSRIFNITKALIVRGAGWNSRIKVASTTPTTTDVFRFYPDSGQERLFSVRDLRIEPNSGTPCRSGICLDQTTSPRFIALAKISGCWIGTFAGYAIRVENGPDGVPDNVTGGVFSLNVHDNQLGGGIGLINAGDSIHIQDNVIWGPGFGVDAVLISGASTLRIADNNITSLGGVRIRRAHHVVIEHNELEMPSGGTSTCSNNHMVDLSGTTGNLIHPVVRNNQFQASTIPGVQCIRVGSATAATVDDNVMSTSTGVVAVTITASATDTYYGKNHQFGAGFEVSNSGTNTLFNAYGRGGTGWTAPAFTGGWTNYGAGGFLNAAYKRDTMGMVHMRGAIAGGTIGSAAFTLPAGSRPPGTQRFYVGTLVDINTSGVVTPVSGGTTLIDLSGIHFEAA